MLKYIFAALLILLVWALWWYMGLPLQLAIGVTVLVVLILAIVVVTSVVKARRAARQLEQGMLRQGASQIADARPDQRAEINAMASEFAKAVAALEGSKMGKQALFRLPWYVIIGPPGVGKSTALRHSGLQFPYMSEQGGRSVKGIGGTRNCDWWMTNQAVIVDTAGRYTTEEGDHEEWLAFLDLLKVTRPKRPINGVLLAVAVSELALASEEQLNAMAGKIRARIDELSAQLEMSVPVYVLFTKCDLLPGFVETYGHMSKSERRAIFGFTLPVSGPGVGLDPRGSFGEQFEQLATRMEQRALRRMGEERRAEARGKIYEFPQHFELLHERLSNFIGLVFSANVYVDTPMLRGCYFISGTQEGRPLDRLMGSMAEAFGIQAPASDAAQIEPRSYFLGDLFNKVIFADRELGRRSAGYLRRALIYKWVGAACTLALAVGLCVFPVRSMWANQLLIDELGAVTADLEQPSPEADTLIVRVERVYPIYRAQLELHGYELEGPPLHLRWGMYQGAELMPPVRALFARTVRAELVVPLFEAKQRELDAFVARYPEDEEPPLEEASVAFETLRAYLLLAGEFGDYRTVAELSEELFEAGRVREDAWLAKMLARWWGEALLVEYASERQQRIEAMSTSYVEILREQPSLELDYDSQRVEAVREVLGRSDRTEATLAQLIESAAEVEGVTDLRLKSLGLGTKVYKNDGVRVRGAFTRQGWERYCRAELGENRGEFAGYEWVLGMSAREASRSRIVQRVRLRSRYFDQYIKEWDRFLARVYVDTAEDLPGALVMFEELARGETALRVLIGAVDYHTTLEDVPDADGQAPWYDPSMLSPEVRRRMLSRPRSGVSTLVERRDVQAYFEPFLAFGVDPSAAVVAENGEGPPPAILPIDSYAEQLKTVRDGLQSVLDDSSKVEAFAEELDVATRVVKAQVAEQREPWRNRFDRILRPPFDAARLVGQQRLEGGINASWCSAVYQPFEQKVADKYPFVPDGRDLPLSELGAWFGPEGSPIWEFHDHRLGGWVQRDGSEFTLVDRGEATRISINAQLPTFLTEVADIGEVLFPPDAEAPLFEFEVQIVGSPGISELSLSVDGQTVSYRNEPPSWSAMVWPGTEGDPGASIRAVALDGEGLVVRGGEWGLWRLMELGTVSGSAGQGVFSVKWDLSDQHLGVVTMYLRPKRLENPLFGVPARGHDAYLGMFTALRVPESAFGAGVCAPPGESPTPAEAPD